MQSPYLMNAGYYGDCSIPAMSMKEKYEHFYKIFQDHVSDVRPVMYINRTRRCWCDALLLRGYMLAAAGFAGDMAAANALLEDIIFGSELTGVPGRLLRDWGNVAEPSPKSLADTIGTSILSDSQYLQYSPVDQRYLLWTNVSRDQLYGLAYGMTVCRLHIKDADFQAKLKEFAFTVLQRIIADGYKLLNPSGTKTNDNDLGLNSYMPEYMMPTMILMLLAGEYSKFDAAYTTLARLTISYMPYDFTWFNYTNCNNQLMYSVGNYCLGALTNRVEFGKNLERQYKGMYKYFNPMLYYHMCQLKGESGDEDSTICVKKMLQLFPTTKVLSDVAVSTDIKHTWFYNRYGQATASSAVHPACNNDFFNWTADTRNVSGNGWNGATMFAPSDYLIAYSLGKRTGLIGDDE